MSSGHDEKFDGLFGEENAPEARPARRAPLAGLFGLRRMAVRTADRKFPGVPPAERKQEPDQR